MGYIGLEPTQRQSDEAPRENLIINGFFDIWQRGDSQTDIGWRSIDRWFNAFNNAIVTVEKGYFTSDGTATGTYDAKGLPNNPKYFLRTNILSITDIPGSWVVPITRLPIANDTAGRDVTVKFWAKADTNKNTIIEVIRETWSAGAAERTFFWESHIELTTEWKQYTETISITEMPTLLLTESATLRLSFLFSSDNLSIAGQTGIFDIANVEMYLGSTDKPVRRKSYEEELVDCLTYYETGIEKYSLWAIYTSTQGIMNHLTFKVPKANVPSIRYDTLGVGKNATGITFSNMTNLGCQVVISGSGMAPDESGHISFNWQAEAEI